MGKLFTIEAHTIQPLVVRGAQRELGNLFPYPFEALKVRLRLDPVPYYHYYEDIRREEVQLYLK